MKTINFFKTALLTIALFVCGNVGAETATSEFLSSKTTDPQIVEDGKPITYKCSSSNNYENPARIYKNSTFTISTTDNSIITKIELSGPSSNPLTNFTCETGDYQATTTNATWTGEATSVIFNASNDQTRVSSIIVTYTPATAASVATPTLSIPTGKYTEAQNVTIDCATAEASIYYTLDGTEPSEQSTPYNGAINISSTTTLMAIAIKDGESSAVATATYTILTATPATIADFLAAEESEDVYYELTGTISNITNTTYGNFDLTDATGTVYVYGLTSTFQTSNDKSFASLNLAEGDLITIRGTRASFEGDAQVNGPAYFVSKTELPTLETPTAIAATEITSTGFTANWNAVTNATSYEVNVWTEETIEFGVANSSFENGLDNWTAESGYAISAEQAHTGTQSISFTATDARDLRQTINNVTPGETITVTYWYYLDESTTGNGPRLWCTWEGNSADKTLQAQEYSNTKGAWTEATMSTTVPDGATALNLEIRVYKNSNGYLDDITVTQTNAATTVLTPIGGSPFTATETSKEITDLAAETTYYYNVVAKAEGYTASEASNTISVTTTAEVAEPTITIEGEDLVETEGMYSVALGDTKFSTKTSKTFTLTATGITESIKIKPEIMSGYFTIISSDSEQAEVVEESSMFGTSKVLTFTPDENGEINAVCTISNRTDSEFADYEISNGEEMLQMFDLTFGTTLTEQWGILYQNQTANITKVITVSLTPTEESTGTGLCNQPEMEGVTFNGEEIINSLNLDVVVYNAVGQMVVRSIENINMSSYPAGVYVIKAANGESMKIVK